MTSFPSVRPPIKSTRQTKQATIERTISVTADDDFGSRTIWATVFERHVKKTKTTCTSEVYVLSRFDTDFGVGVYVEKQLAEGEAYDVNISAALGNQCSCPAGAFGLPESPSGSKPGKQARAIACAARSGGQRVESERSGDVARCAVAEGGAAGGFTVGFR